MSQAPVAEIEEFMRQALAELLGFFGLSPELKFASEDNVLTIGISTQNDDVFLSQDIQPVLALQHIVRVLARKKFPTSQVSIAIDIGNFHAQQDTRLKEIAAQAAAQARLGKEEIHLPPMTSYERRIVHLAVAEIDGVSSESIGDASVKKVIISAD